MIEKANKNRTSSYGVSTAHILKPYYLWSIGGSIALILTSLLNIIDLVVSRWSYIGWFRQYLVRSTMHASMIPIAIAIGLITDDFFKGFIRTEGRNTKNWLLAYSVAELISLITLSTLLLGAFTLLLIIVGKVVAFVSLDRTFLRLKKDYGVKLKGTLIYPFFGAYAIIIALIVGIASNVHDYETEFWLTAANATIESIFGLIIGVKLLVDFLKVLHFIKNNGLAKDQRYQ
ncbi:MAG: hypothetical protein ACTSQE_04210 [Candidatus Heimdallarchaeaceae archaeon]